MTFGDALAGMFDAPMWGKLVKSGRYYNLYDNRESDEWVLVPKYQPTGPDDVIDAAFGFPKRLHSKAAALAKLLKADRLKR